MEIISLNASVRNPETEKAKITRKEGFVPGVVYGQGKEAISIKIEAPDFIKVYRSAGENTLIDLKIDQEKPVKVLIQEVIWHPVYDQAQSIDFIIINMKKEITASIPFNFVGISPAVKDLGGMLVTKKEDIEVTCLPSDLVHEIDVDISVMMNIGDNLHIRDINVPETLTIEDPEDLLVAQVIMPKNTVEETETEEDEEAVEGEAVEEKGQETEEGETTEAKSEEEQPA